MKTGTGIGAQKTWGSTSNPPPPIVATNRITQSGDKRITQTPDNRITQ